MTAALAHVRRGGVRGDPVEPRRELGLAAELPDPLPSPQVCVLGHVARVLLVAGEPVRKREGVSVRQPDQLLERQPVTALGGCDQLTIVHMLSVRRHVRSERPPRTQRGGSFDPPRAREVTYSTWSGQAMVG